MYEGKPRHVRHSTPGGRTETSPDEPLNSHHAGGGQEGALPDHEPRASAPVPAPTLADPAFLVCLGAAATNVDLLAQYDRLRGSNLQRRGAPIEVAIDHATGRFEAEAQDFVRFVHDAVFCRLDPDILQQLRDTAAEVS